MVGNNGMKYSPASSPSAAMARVAGPPHGVIPLMMLSDNIAMMPRIIGFMPIRLYKGNIAAQVIMYVVVPSPSSATVNDNSAVPIAIFIGSPLTRFRILRINGSNRPASIIKPKKRMANNNNAAEGATIFRPSNIIFPVVPPNPPISANAIGTSVKATIGERRLVMISNVNTTTMANPSKASIDYSLIVIDEVIDNHVLSGI